jgi:hypothetical protein
MKRVGIDEEVSRQRAKELRAIAQFLKNKGITKVKNGRFSQCRFKDVTVDTGVNTIYRNNVLMELSSNRR